MVRLIDDLKPETIARCAVQNILGVVGAKANADGTISCNCIDDKIRVVSYKVVDRMVEFDIQNYKTHEKTN